MSEPEKCDYCDDTATNPTDIDEIVRWLRSRDAIAELNPGPAIALCEKAADALERLQARAEAAENEIEELREREWLRENRQLRAEIERLKAERDELCRQSDEFTEMDYTAQLQSAVARAEAAEAKADASIWAELRAHDEYSKWKDRAEAAEKEVERLKAMIDGAFT